VCLQCLQLLLFVLSLFNAFCFSVKHQSPAHQWEHFSLFSGTEGLLIWNDNWVSFLDAMLQMQIIAVSGRELRLPTRIRSLSIDPVRHEKFVSVLEDGTKGTVD